VSHSIPIFLVELVENPLVWKKTTDRSEIVESLVIFNIGIIDLPVIVCRKIEGWGKSDWLTQNLDRIKPSGGGHLTYICGGGFRRFRRWLIL
jgi:hypothetical protein